MPYWRLSSFYLFYFAALGALIPFWTLYLSSLGFNSIQIGQLMAIPTATKIVAPYIWGWLGDHIGKRMAIVRTGSLLAFLTFLLVFWLTDYGGLALAMSLFSFFWNAALPQFEATTLNHLGAQTHRYSSIRLWGSIGFIVAVAGLGALFEQAGTALLPTVLLGLLAAPSAAGGWLAAAALGLFLLHRPVKIRSTSSTRCPPGSRTRPGRSPSTAASARGSAKEFGTSRTRSGPGIPMATGRIRTQNRKASIPSSSRPNPSPRVRGKEAALAAVLRLSAEAERRPDATSRPTSRNHPLHPRKSARGGPRPGRG